MAPHILYQVVGTDHLVPILWYQVCGTKYLVPHTWCKIFGPKHLVPIIWYQVLHNRVEFPLGHHQTNTILSRSGLSVPGKHQFVLGWGRIETNWPYSQMCTSLQQYWLMARQAQMCWSPAWSKVHLTRKPTNNLLSPVLMPTTKNTNN
jgi:hypothetical protein